MTDNAFAYVKNRSLRELLAAHGIRHLTTQPYRPRTNGKVERFHQTMAREWAYGLSLPLQHRTAARPCHTGSTTTTAAGRTALWQPAAHQPRSQRLRAGHLIWPLFCRQVARKARVSGLFLLVGRGGGPGVCATRGQPDMRGLGTAGPGFWSSPGSVDTGCSRRRRSSPS